jgi:hypothetical protein
MQHNNPKKISRTMMLQLVKSIFEKDSGNPVGPVDQQSEYFEEKMAAALPKDFFDQADLPDHLSVLCDISGISKNETFKSVIKNDKVELSLLVKMKDYFKELSSESSDEMEHQIYIAIYYAAIASALMYHDEKISSYSYEELAANFGRLSKEDWLPEYILKLYRKARTYCSQKATT